MAFLVGHQRAHRPNAQAPMIPPKTRSRAPSVLPPAWLALSGPQPGARSLTDVRHHHRVVHRHMHSQGAPGVKDSQLPTRKGGPPDEPARPEMHGHCPPALPRGGPARSPSGISSQSGQHTGKSQKPRPGLAQPEAARPPLVTPAHAPRHAELTEQREAPCWVGACG